MELFTAPELARIYHVAEGTIRRWVCQDRIPAGRRGPRKAYRHRDVQAAYDKRHPEANADTPIAA